MSISVNVKKPLQSKTRMSIGLDIGTDLLKIVEITAAEDKPRLARIGVKKLSDHSSGGLVNSVKLLLQETKITGKNAAISISGPNVIMRFMTLPNMKEDELRSAIGFEAEKFMPFDIKDSVIDFQKLGTEDKESKINILLVAAKKNYVLERIKTVEEAGISVTVVDVDCFALANSFLKNHPTDDMSKSFALINIGSTLTNLSVLRGPSIYFARDIVMGAADFMVSISKKLGINIKSTDELKSISRTNMKDVISYVKSALVNFLDDVRLSFSHYENQTGMGIDEIFVSGGAADFVGFNEAFEESFGSRPASWNPLQFLDISSANADAKFIEDNKNLFAVSLGLALR